jgi:hypothetical protein
MLLVKWPGNKAGKTGPGDHHQQHATTINNKKKTTSFTSQDDL